MFIKRRVEKDRICATGLNPDFTALCWGGVSSMCLLEKVLSIKHLSSLLGRELERGFSCYIYPRHSERSEESQGFEIRTTKVPRHPEFISGSDKLVVTTNQPKHLPMLKQVQHDKTAVPSPQGAGSLAFYLKYIYPRRAVA